MATRRMTFVLALAAAGTADPDRASATTPMWRSRSSIPSAVLGRPMALMWSRARNSRPKRSMRRAALGAGRGQDQADHCRYRGQSG